MPGQRKKPKPATMNRYIARNRYKRNKDTSTMMASGD
jgi:hypothetical protein